MPIYYLFNIFIMCIIFSLYTNDYSHAQNNEKISQTNYVKLYAGPGEKYKFIAHLSDKNIKEYIKLENDWIEIEYIYGRAYVNKKEVKNIDISSIPYITRNITTSPKTGKEIYFFNIPYTTTNELKIYSSPQTNNRIIDKLDKGISITILQPNVEPDEKLKFNNFSYIEYNCNGYLSRGYVKNRELQDLDNPLKNFDKIKKNNGEFIYKKESFFSSSGQKLSFNKWKQIYSNNLVDKKFDYVQALTGALSGNTDYDPVKKIELLDTFHDKYVELDINMGKLKQRGCIFLDLLGMVNNFIEEGNKNLLIHVELEQYSKEGRIRILFGAPIEKGHAGQTIYLSTLIVNADHTKALGTHKKEADEFCRSIYQSIKGEDKCDIRMKFSKNISNTQYGYNIIFDNKGNCYLNPIIHTGTEFKIYQKDKYIADIAPLIASLHIPLNKNDTMRIINLLAKNEIYYKNFKHRDLVQIVVNGTIEELKFALDTSKNYDKDIAAHVALLYSKNDFLEEFLRRDIFPNACNFLTLNHIKEINEPTTEKIAKKIEELESDWADGGVEGDCATLDPYSIIFEASPKQLELILTYNKNMCSGELMCGATTLQLIGDDKRLKRAYVKACR